MNEAEGFLLEKPISYASIENQKHLAVIWDENLDVLKFDFNEVVEIAKGCKTTKQNILKILSSFYGLIQPIIVLLKMFFSKTL